MKHFGKLEKETIYFFLFVNKFDTYKFKDRTANTHLRLLINTLFLSLYFLSICLLFE